MKDVAKKVSQAISVKVEKPKPTPKPNKVASTIASAIKAAANAIKEVVTPVKKVTKKIEKSVAQLPEPCPPKPTRKISADFSNRVPFKLIDINLGVFVLSIEGEVSAKLKLLESEKAALMSFSSTFSSLRNINLDMMFSEAIAFFDNMEFSPSYGFAGQINLNLSTKTKNTTTSLSVILQTINIFANNSVGMTCTSNVNKYVKISFGFNIVLNHLLCAALAVGAVMSLPTVSVSFEANCIAFQNLLANSFASYVFI